MISGSYGLMMSPRVLRYLKVFDYVAHHIKCAVGGSGRQRRRR
jgi:hypothetical protein